MKHLSSTKTILLLTAIAAFAAVGLFSSLSGGLMMSTYAQSSSATQISQSAPPTPKEQPDVAQQFTFNAKSLPPNNIDQCVKYAKELVGKAIPDHNLCDLVVYRQAPAVTRSDGMIMNNFSGMGHYIELIPAAQVLNESQAFGGTAANSSANATGPSAGGNNSNSTTVVAFGEFSLIDPEVVPVHKVLDKYNWTVTTIHNHMLDESPKLLFMHWTVTGNADEIVRQAKEAIMQTSSYATVPVPTNSTRGGLPSSAGP